MGGGARRHYGLTRAQLCHMAALAALGERTGSFAAPDVAADLKVELPCAARYLRELEALGMIARIGRARDRHARIRYVVTAAWDALAREAPKDDLLRGRCAGCGTGGRSLVIFRRALWCADCLSDPRITNGDDCAEADCPRCGRRLEINGDHRPGAEGARRAPAFEIRAVCYGCRRGYGARGRTADEAWAALIRGLGAIQRELSAAGARAG